MGIAGEEVRRLHGNGGDAGVDCSQQEVGFFDTSMMTPISNLDFSVDPPIDPSLWDPQHTLIHSQPQYQPERDSTDSTIISCTCLSLTYLTVTDLQSVSTFSFPLVIQPLRKAMATLETLVHCSICPLDPFSAIQNIASFSALFRAITSRFSKVLHEVDLEAARLAERGAKKSYRIGDNSTALMHMHTGTPDCPMGFDVDLEPQDWKRLVKTALRMEVYGGAGRALWLMGLLSEAEQRQKRWHSEGEFQCEERRRLVGKTTGSTCHALGSEHMRVLVDMLNFE
ncbi:hypothetical protein P153DRAFT_364996 [Dothidotthia symphoricarpi CBS 119687]|uniref:Uncharacterized protein n=1 Tax=Dothidotthia symphoricarpi CBS 119687 TaxID=1392245 RepID=A0A6A6AJW7_9PLEO|nr:uncharacterized protein P153DRAFT_364996 [Dothidotthia symphoricarpi CBS 119687]KAF2131408.1 hypothetical protein P153DRAFT_364996 [Dothidotthia symphoricarpi CBS 119687]